MEVDKRKKEIKRERVKEIKRGGRLIREKEIKRERLKEIKRERV